MCLSPKGALGGKTKNSPIFEEKKGVTGETPNSFLPGGFSFPPGEGPKKLGKPDFKKGRE